KEIKVPLCAGLCAISDRDSMPRRSPGRSQTRELSNSREERRAAARRKHRRLLLGGLALFAAILSAVVVALLWGDSPAKLHGRALAAVQRGEWKSALHYWRLINATRA